eukprot:1158096-Pelagomonas_calceolata.AAC.12
MATMDQNQQHQSAGWIFPEVTWHALYLVLPIQVHGELHSLEAKRHVWRNILGLGVGGVIYTPHALELLEELGFDCPHKATKLALKLHAYFVQYAYKLASTIRPLEKTSFNSRHQDQARGTARVYKVDGLEIEVSANGRSIIESRLAWGSF